MAEQTDGLADVNLYLVDSVEMAGKFLSWLGERRPYDGAISIDIETGERRGGRSTDALSPWHGDIRLVQVGDGMTGWSIPWADWAGVFYQGLTDYHGPVVCHNIAFESKWFDVNSKYKMPWDRAHDTMIMSQVIDPLGTAALKRLAALHVDSKAVALQDTLSTAFSDNGWTWGTVPVDFQPYWAYGALDTVLTMRVFDKFWKDTQPGARYSEAYELEMAARRICTRMEVNGARVDLEYSQKKYDELVAYTAKAREIVSTRFGGTSISSNVQLVRLFESMGTVISRTTPSGQKKMDADQLEIIQRDGGPAERSLAELVLNQRKADKLASSYFLNFLNDNIDGIVHPSIRTMGARTGRMSITDPALQTLPSKDPLVRRAFVPRDDGFKIITSDLDQVEFRLAAALSRDPALVELFREADATKGDVFTAIMQDVYQNPLLTKDDPRRKLIKSMIYGKIYGAGIEKSALTAGVQAHHMKDIVEAFDRNYPGIKSLQRSIEDVGMKRLNNEGQGYVVTKTGRRLPCDDDRIYSLTNYLIQASAAEIFKANLVKMDMQDLTENMIVPVHDEIVLQAPEKDAKEIMETVRECMTTTDGWEVALTSGVDGPYPNWGTGYEPKPKK